MRFVADASRDLRHATRVLHASPGVTLVAVAALAVGIGVNLTIFGFVNATLLHPLAAGDPDRLIRASREGPDLIAQQVSYPEYRAYRDGNQTLSDVALFHWGGIASVRTSGQPAEPIHLMPVTGNYFATLGVNTVLGRPFTDADDRPGGAGRVVVLSDEGWRVHFHADPGVVGQTIFIHGVPHTVIGVLPAGFLGTVWPVIPRLYVTWAEHSPPISVARGGVMIGRLRQGVDLTRARADAARIAAQIAQASGGRYVFDLSSGDTAIRSDTASRLTASLLLIVVGAVLWVACGNVAILQLARTVARRREMAIRLSLGATRLQLLRQVLMETLLLAIISGAGAMLMAFAAARWLTQLRAPVPMPLALVFYFDWRVAGFAFGLTIVAALLTGFTAALDSRRTRVTGLLHQQIDAAHARVSRGLIVAQVAISTVLLVIATSLGLGLLEPLPRGLDADRVLMGGLTLPASKYSPEESRAFFDQLQTRMEQAPGIVSATVVDTIPLANDRPLPLVEMTAADDSTAGRVVARVLVNEVSRGHFTTLGIPLVAGRDFNDDDAPGAPAVVIVNQTFARRYWPNGSAIGRRVRFNADDWVTIVGIAKDSKYQSFDEPPTPFIYRPFGQVTHARLQGTLLIKTAGDPMQRVSTLRSVVAELDPDLAVFNLNALESRLSMATLPNRTAASLSGLLGALALGLGTIGTYSIMAFLTLQRRREIGIRVALGAVPSAVVALIAQQGLRRVAAGLIVGTAMSVGALRLLQGRLYGVSAANPLPMLLVVALIGISGYLACALPTRRAAKGDPVAALRES